MSLKLEINDSQKPQMRERDRQDKGNPLRRIRVLLVSPVGECGGAERVLLSLVQSLPKYGVEPVVACMRPGPLTQMVQQIGAEAYAFRDHRMRELGNVALGIQWLARLVRRLDVDVIHSNFTAHLYGGPAALIAHKPELWHLYDYPYRPDALERLVMHIPSDYLLFATRRVESGFPRLQKLPHSVVYPICVDADAVTAHPYRADVRERHGLPPGPLLLTVARLQQHKGHRYLLEAAPQILEQYPDAVFGIVGKASGSEQERYERSLKSECDQLGISANVKFLGYVSDEDLMSLYREATALVHPALSEGFGLTLLEAMALGVPVIAASADGPAEIITHEKTGLLVPTGDSGALASEVIRLLQAPRLAETLRLEGARYAKTFDVENMVRQTASIYHTMLPT